MASRKMGPTAKSTVEGLGAVPILRPGEALPVSREQGEFEFVTDARFA